MRSDIVPGGIFPDYELPDHTGKVRRLSELRGDESPTRERGLMTATTATAPSAAIIEAIKQRAKRLSILSMMSTTAAGSGHPTSCMSAAELVAGTFFYAMKFDPKDPNSPDGDCFVLSKGHAAPVLLESERVTAVRSVWADVPFDDAHIMHTTCLAPCQKPNKIRARLRTSTRPATQLPLRQSALQAKSDHCRSPRAVF